MEKKWTEAQSLAINTKDKTLLVCAAAGSGKTAALTEFGHNGSLRAPSGSGVAVQEKLFNAVDMIDLMKNLKKQGLKISYVLTWCGGCGAIYTIGKGEEALRDPFCIDLERLNKLYEY